jgi:hypothetical protein
MARKTVIRSSYLPPILKTRLFGISDSATGASSFECDSGWDSKAFEAWIDSRSNASSFGNIEDQIMDAIRGKSLLSVPLKKAVVYLRKNECKMASARVMSYGEEL